MAVVEVMGRWVPVPTSVSRLAENTQGDQGVEGRGRGGERSGCMSGMEGEEAGGILTFFRDSMPLASAPVMWTERERVWSYDCIESRL